jgi:hypothetical protein
MEKREDDHYAMKKRMKNIYFWYLTAHKWKEKFWNEKWLNKTEEVAHNKIINCTKITKLKNLRRILYNLIENGHTKWKKKVQDLEEVGDEVL